MTASRKKKIWAEVIEIPCNWIMYTVYPWWVWFVPCKLYLVGVWGIKERSTSGFFIVIPCATRGSQTHPFPAPACVCHEPPGVVRRAQPGSTSPTCPLCHVSLRLFSYKAKWYDPAVDFRESRRKGVSPRINKTSETKGKILKSPGAQLSLFRYVLCVYSLWVRFWAKRPSQPGFLLLW